MTRNILGALAEFERETIVERIKAGLAEKARQGELVGPLSLGYRRDSDKRVILDPVIAPLVRELFDRYATGQYSLRDMTVWAAKVGLQSSAGNPLDRLSIRKILVNVTYTGQVARYLRRGGGVIAQGKHPAVVDVATCAKVQDTLTRKRLSYTPKRPFGRDPYPLSGVATCAYDGASLLGLRAGHNDFRYMRCSTASRQGRDACQQPMVQAELLEAQLAAYVEEMRARQRRVEPDPSEADRLRRAMERWRRLFVLGEIDEAEYKREVGPVRQRLAQLERPQEVLDVERAVQYLRDAGSLWSKSPRQLQRAFVREVFTSVVVKGPQLAAITPKPSYAPLFRLDRRERFYGQVGVVWLPIPV